MTAVVVAAVAVIATASPAAADFSAFAVPVSCTDLAGAPAWADGVFRDDGTVELRATVCAAIDRAAARNLRDRRDVVAAALAVMLLGHELSHALGTHDLHVTATGEDEAEADCVGWLLFRWTAGKLRLARATVDRLADAVRADGAAACASWGLR